MNNSISSLLLASKNLQKTDILTPADSRESRIRDFFDLFFNFCHIHKISSESIFIKLYSNLGPFCFLSNDCDLWKDYI